MPAYCCVLCAVVCRVVLGVVCWSLRVICHPFCQMFSVLLATYYVSMLCYVLCRLSCCMLLVLLVVCLLCEHLPRITSMKASTHPQLYSALLPPTTLNKSPDHEQLCQNSSVSGISCFLHRWQLQGTALSNLMVSSCPCPHCTWQATTRTMGPTMSHSSTGDLRLTTNDEQRMKQNKAG